MALWEPAQPPKLVNPPLPSTYGLTTKIRITPELENNRQFLISWTPALGAVRYIVYVSPSPMTRNVFRDDILAGETSTIFEVPIVVPDDIVFYVWVGYVDANNTVVLLQDEPVYVAIDTAFTTSPMSAEIKRDIITDDDMTFYVEEIRRRNLAMLQNDGEDFDLYIRRMYGQPCVCLTNETGEGHRVEPVSTGDALQFGQDFDPHAVTDAEASEAKDPEYQGSYRCLNCLGTGIAGGYYPSIRMRARYGNLPTRIIKLEKQGIEFSHDFNSWTIWHPRLKERDVMVRLRTGERMSVKDPGQSELRGIPMHQEFTLVSEPENSMLYQISNANIIKALEEEGGYGVGKWSWALFK